MFTPDFFEGTFNGGELFDTSSFFDPNNDSIIRIDDGPTTPPFSGGGSYTPYQSLNIETNDILDFELDKTNIDIKKGCLDRRALNYDPNAKISDNSVCQYEQIEPTILNEDYLSKVSLTFTSNQSNTDVKIDGSSVGTAPTSILYTDKELLTPKIITASKSGYNSNEQYKVYTVKRTFKQRANRVFDSNGNRISLSDRPQPTDLINFNKTTPPEQLAFANNLTSVLVYTYYELFVTRIQGLSEIPVAVPNITDAASYDFKEKRNVAAPISFTLSQVVTDPPPKQPLDYKVRIISDLPFDNSIIFTNPQGTGGGLKVGSPFELNFKTFNPDEAYLDFKANGLSADLYTVEYEYRLPNKVNVGGNNGGDVFKVRKFDTRVQLSPGLNEIQISVVKQPSKPIPEGTPLISVKPQQVSINKSDINLLNEQYQISYQTENADYIIYSKGSEQQELPPSGTIQLNANQFEIGTTKIFLQPVSRLNGSGPLETVFINVSSKSYIPGPDITHIDYPRVIKGEDFVEYNVDFNVIYQSVNTNYINIYAGSTNSSNLLTTSAGSGKVKLNVADVIKKSGQSIDEYRDITIFKLFLIPYNSEGDEITSGKTEEIEITFDKGDLKLRRPNVIDDIKRAFESDLDESGFKDFTSPFLTHYVHIGDGDNKLVGTWGIDNDTLSTKRINPRTNKEEIVKEEKTLVLKLYEPLPQTVSTNDKVWISKIQSIPIVDEIRLTEDFTEKCTRLTPNFDLDFYDDIGFQIYDELVASGSATSTDVVNEFVSSSGFSLENLDLNFVTGSDYYWENFIKYSNAEERVENFYYKVKLIEAYQDKINTNNNNTGSLSPAILKENERNQTQINNIKKEFDAFEKFLFVSSSEGQLTYPKTNNTGSLLHTTSSDALSWYNGIKYSAQQYDYNNLNSLRNNLPEHILNDGKNSDYILFFDMIGQHFDVVYTHAKGFAQSRKLEHKLDSGIKDSLVYHMLESLGWETKSGLESQVLWEYAFGLSKDGTQISEIPGRDRQEQIWRRILNNLPYLYKHKGTKRAIHAAMSAYGVPASLLTVMEFGGPKDPTSSGTTKFTFEDRTAAINISDSAAITIPWKEYSGDHPNAVEIRVQTSEKQNQRIIGGDNWSLDVINTGTGSLARIELTVGDQSSSTNPIPFFNDEYSSIFINRISGSNYSFDLYVKEAFQERIRNELSASLLDNHTLLPDAINGNHVSSSTEDLLFRNDFEYPKNRSTSGDVYIKNVALLDDYTSFSTASNFENVTDYPYQYTPYDRTVTADVPSSGFNVGNKVRFEDQTLIADLNYKTRATRKMYDQAPVDSNRLGLFFSPIKEINMDILRSLGSFNIDNYIGDPSDDYSYEYRNLRDLRNYYFDRYTLNFQEYIQLVRYIDKSLFDVLESLVPARSKVSKGLLIEPHILERSKTDWTKPTGSNDSYQTKIDTQENINIVSTEDTHLALISSSDETALSAETPFYSSSIDAQTDVVLTGDKKDYEGLIQYQDSTDLNGFITVNSGSTMGGIEINIDATTTASIVTQYDSTQNYQQVGGFGPEDLSVAGFGLYGENGESIRTYIDVFGNKVKDRVKVYLLTEQYTELVPTISGSKDSEYYRLSVPLLEEVTKYRTKVNILPFTGSDGLESQLRFTSSLDLVDYEPLNGYFPTHYRYVGDLPTGLQNSYYNGSRFVRDEITGDWNTLDGGSPVVTFTTNPNTLRVSDTGRGSGEPILEVD